MSNLRVASADDIPLVLDLGFKFLAKSPYRDMELSPEPTRQWLAHCIVNGVVIIADEDSFICGTTLNLPFATDLVAAELAWGSTKQGINAAKVEKQLLEAFEYWARNIAKADAIQIGSFHGEKFFLRRGYKKCETLYMVKL